MIDFKHHVTFSEQENVNIFTSVKSQPSQLVSFLPMLKRQMDTIAYGFITLTLCSGDWTSIPFGSHSLWVSECYHSHGIHLDKGNGGDGTLLNDAGSCLVEHGLIGSAELKKSIRYS